MKLVRVTVRHNPDDPADDLRVAAKIRRDLWSRSSIEVDPDDPMSRLKRDAQRDVYFEFVTEYPEGVQEALKKIGYEGRATVEVLPSDVGLVCANCNRPSGFATKCPHCGYRDIDPCPLCEKEVPREHYEPISGDLFRCPACHGRVRLEFNPVLVRSGDRLNEPAVVVQAAQG